MISHNAIKDLFRVILTGYEIHKKSYVESPPTKDNRWGGHYEKDLHTSLKEAANGDEQIASFASLICQNDEEDVISEAANFGVGYDINKEVIDI